MALLLSQPPLPTRSSQRLSNVRGRSGVVAMASPAMRYNKLGDSDLAISEVTLGTMTWGVQNSEADAHEQLSYAFDNGINTLDTAEMYPVPANKETQGRTDRYIASWLKNQKRDKVIVATKVAGYSDRSTYLRDSGKTTRVDAENIKESVEKSLQRLGTDYIDLLQIHWPDRYVPLFGEFFYDMSKWRESVPFEEQLKALQDVIQQGKVRYIGVSNETSLGVMKFVDAAQKLGLPKIVSIQNSYSLLVRCRFEVDLTEVCSPKNCNVGLLAYSPLAGGALSGKYADQNSEAAKRGRFMAFPGYMSRYNSSLAQEAVQKYANLAQQHGLTPVQLALAFVRDRPFVTSSIIGATTMAQLKENLEAFLQVTRPLPDEITAGVEDVFKRYKDVTILQYLYWPGRTTTPVVLFEKMSTTLQAKHLAAKNGHHKKSSEEACGWHLSYLVFESRGALQPQAIARRDVEGKPGLATASRTSHRAELGDLTHA